MLEVRAAAPYPEEGEQGEGSSMLESGAGESLPSAAEDDASSLEEGSSGDGTETPGIVEPNLPDGAVITGRDENGTYFETENGGGVILD